MSRTRVGRCTVSTVTASMPASARPSSSRSSTRVCMRRIWCRTRWLSGLSSRSDDALTRAVSGVFRSCATSAANARSRSSRRRRFSAERAMPSEMTATSSRPSGRAPISPSTAWLIDPATRRRRRVRLPAISQPITIEATADAMPAMTNVERSSAHCRSTGALDSLTDSTASGSSLSAAHMKRPSSKVTIDLSSRARAAGAGSTAGFSDALAGSEPPSARPARASRSCPAASSRS